MSLPYQDSTRSIDQRASDLLSRMTLEEKINQMSVRMGSGDAPETAARTNNALQAEALAKSRLGIPMLLTRESSHGLNTVGATSFPACITMASSWDDDLNFRIGRAIANEARAQGVHQGLSPVLDITRDPRWGRMDEGLGEDALLCSRLGVAFIRGLQGDGLKDGIVATPKHFVGYGASEGGKDNDPISLSERDLRETYLPPFEAAVKLAKCESIMTCFGALNGVPCTSDKRLVTDLLRSWGFDGHVVDDCPGIAGLVGHRAARDMKEAVAQGINAGNDRQFYDFIGIASSLETGQVMFEKILLELVREGKVPESRIDDAARRVLRSKFKLGLFEKVQVDPTKAKQIANDPEHKELAREAATKGIVLLKNANNLLPLKPSLGTIAVIGPNADEGQLGDYSGTPDHIVTPLEGIRALVSPKTKVLYARGCEILSPAMVVGRFSARMHGSLKVDVADDYELTLETNDGARLTIDGKIAINDWTTGPRRHRSAKLRLGKGDHAIQLDYFKGTRGLSTDAASAEANRNVVRLSWSNSSSPSRIIPTDNFTYRGALGVQQHGSGEGLAMDVFLGTNFEQALPEQSRVVKNIDFDWGERSPILADKSQSHETETIAHAVEIARQSDLVVLCIGETSRRGAQQVCGEHFDRADLGLTGAQQMLADAIIATGKPVVVVLINGRSLAIPKLVSDCTAMLEAWYPGEQGGHAIADVLFGKANPSGKLPVSIPHSAGQLPVYYNRRPRMGWYIDAPSEPLFPFGFGLSYTTFDYANLRVDGMRVILDITNSGQHAGDEVIQLYIEPSICTFATPVKKLVDYKRVTIEAGATQTIQFEVLHDSLTVLDADFVPRVAPGEYKVHVGRSSADLMTANLTIP